MSELDLLKNSRKYQRSQVTKLHNKLGEFGSYSDVERIKFKTLLERWSEVLSTQSCRIQALLWVESQDVDELNKELDLCNDYEIKIKECLASLVNPTPSHADTGLPRSLLKSPVAPLPTFSSKEGEDLTKFLLQFEAAISRFQYSDYDKLQLLKQQVYGRASKLLHSLEADKQGYKEARDLLETALASAEVRKFETIKKLSQLKLNYNDDPFDYICDIKHLRENVQKLSITVDDILQFFIWSGLNESFKSQFIQLTNKTRPSLEDITDKFFDVAERYSLVQRKYKERKKEYTGNSADSSLVLAAKVKASNPKPQTFMSCSICSSLEKREADHPIYKCMKFVSPSDKIEQLKKLNACLKCARTNHTTSNCKFMFRAKCSFCSAWHFTFLCIKNPRRSDQNSVKPGSTDVRDSSASGGSKETNSTTESTKKIASGFVSVMECLQTNSDSESILPTFSCLIEGQNWVRAIKDGGCQSNLISESLADKLNLKIVQNKLKLTVSGINVSQEYYTKSVELKVKFGDKERRIVAMCLPFINIHLNLPRLSELVEKFMAKGFTLCDNQLMNGGDQISNIDLILGSKSSYCVPEEEIVFGPSEISVYSQTPFGIMLKGDIKQLLRDLPYLQMEKTQSCSAVLETETKNSNSNSNCTESEGETAVLYESDVNRSDSPNYYIVDKDGTINEGELQRATDSVLEDQCRFYTNYDSQFHNDSNSELNSQLVEFALSKTIRDEEGRLVMPLLWNYKVSHLLGRNFKLSKQILFSNLKKLQTKPDFLNLMNDTILEQENLGIVERVESPENFIVEHPEASFLPHMGIFKLNRETTKCRVVFLSNLCEKDPSKPMTVSHNQCINPGPSLNNKIQTSMLNMRFGLYLLCFDLQRAFNNIALTDTDTNKLLFLWFRNVKKGDFSLIGFRNMRLSFGLRCSPTILMLGLYKILVIDATDDDDKLQNLKKMIYHLSYMDNCAFSMDNPKDLEWAFSQLNSIFNPYHFFLQQFVTNYSELQNDIDRELSPEEPTSSSVKLLGMQWDRTRDTISTRPIELNINATTKRQMLSSIASQFDLFNINGPILNRSRLFMHTLQCDQNLGWDEKLSDDRIIMWRNIVRQANATPQIQIKRVVGGRDDKYRLIAFADASKLIYGAVLFIQNLCSKEVNFLLAKSRIVNSSLESKSIPSLEIQAMALATECLVDISKELTGESCVQPIQITDCRVYSDSLVSLAWLKSAQKLEKMQKKSVFVLNRISQIEKLCEIVPVTFAFVSGIQNPADCITRSMSYKRLVKSNYYDPSEVLKQTSEEPAYNEDLSFTVPNPLTNSIAKHSTVCTSLISWPDFTFFKNVVAHFSSITKIIGAYKMIILFIHKLKQKVKVKSERDYEALEYQEDDLHREALQCVLKVNQMLHFPEIFEYFARKSLKLKDIPCKVKQLNLFKDPEGILRVKQKLGRFKDDNRFTFPILLEKDSRLTELIIQDYHVKFSHAGCYTVLSELRKTYWLTNHFVTIKKNLKKCILCRRLKERTIKLNQSDYREFRVDPPKVPFAYCYLDFWGPVLVKSNENTTKVWVLCVTCMWSRAVNLKVCDSQSVSEFLRTFQLHCFEYGVPQFCISDLGSQLVAASNIIKDFLKDPETQVQFAKSGIKPIQFDQYFKGCSKLGGMVESCVKLTKRLMFGSVKRNILSLRDFEFHICQTVHIVNRRPIAFQSALRDSSMNPLPDPITPELLIKGYELTSYNLNPNMQTIDPDPSWQSEPSAIVKDNYHKLRKVKQDLIDLYHSEFLGTLINQAVDRQDRYKPVSHHSISVGDIVLLKEIHCKPFNYPMGIVREVVLNQNEEVTGAIILKGNTRELVKRHSSTLIPLLAKSDLEEEEEEANGSSCENSSIVKTLNRSRRKAALISEEKTRQMFDSEHE